MQSSEPTRQQRNAPVQGGRARTSIMAACCMVLTCTLAAACASAGDAATAASGSAPLASPSSCIDEAANGQTLAVEENRIFGICLRENPTTGYRWSFDADGSPFAVLVDDSFQSGDDRPGAGGIHRWRFRAAEPGSTKIALSYRRPWEQGVQPEQSFALTVSIEAR